MKLITAFFERIAFGLPPVFTICSLLLWLAFYFLKALMESPALNDANGVNVVRDWALPAAYVLSLVLFLLIQFLIVVGSNEWDDATYRREIVSHLIVNETLLAIYVAFNVYLLMTIF